MPLSESRRDLGLMQWTEARVRRVGTAALAVFGALATALLAALVVGGGTGALPPAAPVVVAVALLALAGWTVLLRYPTAHLVVLLAGFVALFNSDVGIRPSEAAFGLYYLGYLGAWFVRHVVLGDARLVRDGVDLWLVLFLGLVTLQAVTATAYGGDPLLALNQWRTALVLGFYFPIRETVRRDPAAIVPLAGAFLAAALYLTARNLILYYNGLQSAEALYQLVFNRAREGERIYATALLGAVAFAVRSDARSAERVAAFLVALVTAGAVIGGMSRTIWVAILPALAVQLILYDSREWRAVALFIALAGVGLVTLVPLFVGNAFEAVAVGLSYRAESIATSASQDLSLINRFYEWKTAIGAGLQSPVLGRGLGVPYEFYDILAKGTDLRPFSHSTYVGVFYRHGLVGLVLLVGMYLAAAWRAFQMTRTETGVRRTLALTALSAIVLLSISISTEGALLITDGVYSLMYPLAFVGALWGSREESP